MIVAPSNVSVVPVKPEPVSVTCVPPAIGPLDGLMEVIVAGAEIPSSDDARSRLITATAEAIVFITQDF